MPDRFTQVAEAQHEAANTREDVREAWRGCPETNHRPVVTVPCVGTRPGESILGPIVGSCAEKQPTCAEAKHVHTAIITPRISHKDAMAKSFAEVAQGGSFLEACKHPAESGCLMNPKKPTGGSEAKPIKTV